MAQSLPLPGGSAEPVAPEDEVGFPSWLGYG